MATAGRGRRGCPPRERPRRRRALLVGASTLAIGAAGVVLAVGRPGSGSAGGAEGGAWSESAVLSGCSLAASPRVAFPSDRPWHRTGAGAIAWAAAPSCRGGAGVRVAGLGAGDRAAAARTLAAPARWGGAGRPGLELAGAGGGRLSLAYRDELWLGALAQPSGARPQRIQAGAPVALGTAYRGDVAALSTDGRASALVLRMEPHRAPRFGAPMAVAAGAAGATPAAVALDWRTDAVAVWRRGGYLYARYLPHGGQSMPVQRLGRCGPRPLVAALMSDDGRAIVAWMDRERDRTAVYAEISRIGVRFGAPRLLEAYRDPGGLVPPAGSLRLVRLSDERVTMAWTGSAEGRYVVRVADVKVHGVLAPLTIAARPPGADALLSALAAGPRDDEAVLWAQPRMTPRGPDVGREQLLAAWGAGSEGQRPALGEPERVARGARYEAVQLAFDPETDRAVAVWRTAAGVVGYAVRRAGR
jgi:hypothetical protein